MNDRSITGDMPVLIRKQGVEKYVCIQELFKYESESFNKYYKVPKKRILVWSKNGFTEIKYIVKRKCEKQILCIVTSSGIIKVTEGHSLLNSHVLTNPHLPKVPLLNEMSFDNCIDAVKYSGNYDYKHGKYIVSPENHIVETMRIVQLPPTDGYVYDLETENNTFCAGLGEIVVTHLNN